MKKNKKPNSIKNKKGFTLVEVVVAMGMFVIVMAGSSAIFAKSFKSYRVSKNLNENVKNGQFAMNLMTKTFRTSSVISSASNTIDICDYSQDACFRYYFSLGTLYKDTATATIASGACTCGSFSGAPVPITVTTGNVTGSFSAVSSSGTDGAVAGGGSSLAVGKVTVRMRIQTGAGANQSIANLQSTTSLRDYFTSNIGIDPNNPI